MNDVMVWNFRINVCGTGVDLPVVATSHQEALKRLEYAISQTSFIELRDLEGEIRPQKKLILPCEYELKAKVSVKGLSWMDQIRAFLKRWTS